MAIVTFIAATGTTGTIITIMATTITGMAMVTTTTMAGHTMVGCC